MVEQPPPDQVIHEFNNLLTIIVGFTDLLLDDASPEGQIYADLKEIRSALALVSGALLALSFPQYGHPAFGWIALAPLLVAIFRVPLRRAFLLGLLTGCVYFAGTLYWITRVMAVYGDLPAWVAVFVNAAL